MSYDTDGERLRRRWGRRRNCQLSRAGALIVAALLEENRTPAATLFRRTAEPPLSRGARGVQGLSQVGEQSSIRWYDSDPLRRS